MDKVPHGLGVEVAVASAVRGTVHAPAADGVAGDNGAGTEHDGVVEFLECSVKVVCVDGRVEAEGEADGDCFVGAGESGLSGHGVGRIELEGLLRDGR